MTTITVTMNKLNKRLEEHKTLHIPDEITSKTKGLIFIKNVPHDVKFKENSHPGVFVLRTEDGQWGNPVCIHFLAGTLFCEHAWGSCDVLVLINDINVCKVLHGLGQVGFGSSGYRLESGITEFDPDYSRHAFEGRMASDPGLLNSSFAYVIGGYNKVFKCDLKDAVFQFRESSNRKYYETKNASLHNILENQHVHLSSDHHHQLALMNEQLGRFFPKPSTTGNETQRSTIATTSHPPAPGFAPKAPVSQGWGGPASASPQEPNPASQSTTPDKGTGGAILRQASFEF